MFFSFGYEATYSLNFSCALAQLPSVIRSRALRNTVVASLCVLRLDEADAGLGRC